MHLPQIIRAPRACRLEERVDRLRMNGRKYRGIGRQCRQQRSRLAGDLDDTVDKNKQPVVEIIRMRFRRSREDRRENETAMLEMLRCVSLALANVPPRDCCVAAPCANHVTINARSSSVICVRLPIGMYLLFTVSATLGALAAICSGVSSTMPFSGCANPACACSCWFSPSRQARC